MSLLIKGITRISELDIDADKDMTVHGLFNLKEVVAGMLRGDIPVKDTNQLVILLAGTDGYVLTSAGQGKIPVWAPAGGALRYFFPASIDSAHAETVIVAPDHSIPKNAPLGIVDVEAYDDQPGLLIKRLDSSLVSVDAEYIHAGPDQAIAKSLLMPSGLSILCDGFVEETALAVQTDHTAEAREATANDLNLNPMSDTVLDKVYIGSNYPFWQAQVLVGTTGVGNWTNSWYYWNGAWVPVVGEIDGSNEWQLGTGLALIHHTPQGDWVPSVIQGMNLYWLMSRTDNFVSRVAKPLGSQIWVAIA